jgi:hypothetical protein
MYEIKLSKLGYDYTEYKKRVKDYKTLSTAHIEKFKHQILDFNSYTQVIVY